LTGVLFVEEFFRVSNPFIWSAVEDFVMSTELHKWMSHGVVWFPNHRVSGWFFPVWITVISKVDKIINPSATHFHVLVQQWSQPKPVNKLIRMSNSSWDISFSVKESVQCPSTLVVKAVEIGVLVDP